jgi:hypothetical protein
MNLSVLLVILAVVSLAIILRLAGRESLLARSETTRGANIRPIDVQAFRSLTNPAEDQYLRSHLPARQFRKVRRVRLRAMAAYVQAAGQNATVLIRAGQAALESGDPRLAPAAQQLVNQALLLRRNTTIAFLRIHLALAWPGSDFAAIRVVDRYEQLSSSAMLLGRLQNPAVPVRLSAQS